MRGNTGFDLEWIREEIEGFVACSPNNSLGEGFDEPAWGKPIVGAVSARDTLFREFKNAVDPRHFLPEEIFNLHFPERPACAEDIAVLSWVLPQTARTREDNRAQGQVPAERWLRSKLYGESFNDLLRKHVVDWLGKSGVEALAPVLSPHYGRFNSDSFGSASSWSERHVAYACGLGTFGLSEGLITPVGKAARIGSVVLRASLGPIERPYSDPHEYCLFFRDGSCGACVSRCPSGSLRRDGRDKTLCEKYIHEVVEPIARDRWGLPSAYACGLCQVGVPCEKGIPGQASGENQDD